ncbi:DUF4843 domain-containing protein [Pedobacter frigoris]|uniref:DUF4843 domain-containing protein n=1 Tax=Pedobacter frigoris TaxID=2571272 RepID=UPI0029313AF0|nr:DUF4843 domain-containing protein [Pedobacter frigoris]
MTALLILTSVSACKKDDIEAFNDEKSSNSIYFSQSTVRPGDGYEAPINYSSFSFGYMPAEKTDTVLLLPVQTTGTIRNTDRSYSVMVADSSTMVKGIHYDILNTNFSIKSGKVTDTVKVKIYRNALFRTKSYRLDLGLKANENFTTVITTLPERNISKGMVHWYINVDDIAGKPNFWDASYCEYFWGPYSLKKLKLYVEVCNLDINVLTKPDFVLNYTLMRAYARVVRTYLLDMQGKGTPVLEEDGSPMIMGPVI